MAGGSASALSLSRPAQASLTLRPAGSLSRPQATFVTRLQPMRLPAQAACQLPDQSTTLRVDSSSTDDSRLRGALPHAPQSGDVRDQGESRRVSGPTGSRLTTAACGAISSQHLLKVFPGVSESGTERPRLGTDAGKCRLIWRNETTCLSRSPTYPGTFST